MSYDYGKIWVAGANGRVGRMIRNMLDMRDVELFERDKEDLDITFGGGGDVVRTS